jgi:hypothetical protein
MNNYKLRNIEFVCESFIIRNMAMTLSFEVMFDSIDVLKLAAFQKDVSL